MKVEFLTEIGSDGSWHGNWIFPRRVMLNHLRTVCLYGILGGRSQNCEKRLFSFVMPVRLSAWNNSVSTGRIFVKFGISIFRKSVEKQTQVSSKSDKNNGHFTRSPIHIYDHISLNSF